MHPSRFPNGDRMDSKIETLFSDFARGSGNLTVLTGAGVSAESGIPTFRGPEGYWTVGSRNRHPQEMATFQMFSRQPEEVWKWYLHRMNVCAKAEPNPGHRALVEMEHLLGERFRIITQNVDGLHLRAGNCPDRTYHIHGNVFSMRCAGECDTDIRPIPDMFLGRNKDRNLTTAERKSLTCPRCGGWRRPHVLWFDEFYNEHFFKFESALRAAAETDLLLIAGTSGATNLPNQVASAVAAKKGVIVNIDTEENPFSRLAIRNNGYFLQASAGGALPEILKILQAHSPNP